MTLLCLALTQATADIPLPGPEYLSEDPNPPRLPPSHFPDWTLGIPIVVVLILLGWLWVLKKKKH
jgi:hypothetical protein